MFKKYVALIVVLAVFCMGCGNALNETGSTGYESGVQRPQIMYNGTVYFYQAEDLLKKVPKSFSYAGDIKENNDELPPERDWEGSRVTVGQKIYSDENNLDCVYIEYDQGFAKFCK